MLDLSLLTPSKMPVIDKKRRKPTLLESEDLEEVLVKIDQSVYEEKEWKNVYLSDHNETSSKKRSRV